MAEFARRFLTIVDNANDMVRERCVLVAEHITHDEAAKLQKMMAGWLGPRHPHLQALIYTDRFTEDIVNRFVGQAKRADLAGDPIAHAAKEAHRHIIAKSTEPPESD